MLAAMGAAIGLTAAPLPAGFEDDLAALSTMLTNLTSTMAAESEFGGTVQMIPPPDSTVAALRRLAGAVYEAKDDPRSATVAALSAGLAKIGQHRTDDGQRGADHLLLALLQQPLISAHPTASADIYTLIRAMLFQPPGKGGLTLSSDFSCDELCATVDASMQCETDDTLQAASAMLVAVARQSQLHPVLHDDRSLGCMFALHDRSDDADDRKAIVQTDVCLALALLLAPPTTAAHERLLQEGVPQLIDKFTREHSPTTHVEGGSELKAAEVAALCRSAVSEVVTFGQWCLARLAFNYPPDFVSSGCWETLYTVAKEHAPEQRQSGLLLPPPGGLVAPDIQTAATGFTVPETGPMAMQRIASVERDSTVGSPQSALETEGEDHPLVMAAAHVKALEGEVDPAPPVTQLTFTKKGKMGWSTGFGILDRNLTLRIHKADAMSGRPAGVIQTLMLAGNQARVGIHPSRKRSNGDDCMILVGRNEKGAAEELIAHADNDAEMYQWLAGVRRTMDAYTEHGAFMPAGGAGDPGGGGGDPGGGAGDPGGGDPAMDQQYDAALAAAIAASMGMDASAPAYAGAVGGFPGAGAAAGGFPGAGAMGGGGGNPSVAAYGGGDDEMAIALAMSMEDQGAPPSAAMAAAAAVPPPAMQVAAAEPGIVADEGIIASLEIMGFPRVHAAAAARATFNVSTEEAMEWCLTNPAPEEPEQPASPPAFAAAVSMPAGATPFVDDLTPGTAAAPAPAPAPAVDDGWASLGFGAPAPVAAAAAPAPVPAPVPAEPAAPPTAVSYLENLRAQQEAQQLMQSNPRDQAYYEEQAAMQAAAAPPPVVAAPPAQALVATPAKVEMLTGLGFSVEQATLALESSNGDADQAANMLFSAA